METGARTRSCKSKTLRSDSEGSREKMFRSNVHWSKGSQDWHDFPINVAWLTKKRSISKSCREREGVHKVPQPELPARSGILVNYWGRMKSYVSIETAKVKKKVQLSVYANGTRSGKTSQVWRHPLSQLSCISYFNPLCFLGNGDR